METLHASESVNNLIKRLCEKVTSKQLEKQSSDYLKRLRSNAYEILLHKRLPENDADFELQNRDSLCRLLAWQFNLAHNYDQLEHSEKLGECIKKIEGSALCRNTVLVDMIDVLLQIKSVPNQKRIQGSKLYSTHKTFHSGTTYRIFDERSFHLPPDLYAPAINSKTSLESLTLKKKSTFIAFVEDGAPNIPVKNTTSINSKSLSTIPSNNSNTSSRDKVKLKCPAPKEKNIWEIVSESKYERRRTWETLEDPCPKRERPFLPEAGKNVGNLLRHMQSSVFADVISGKQDVKVQQKRKISSEQFVKDLKLLLVGVSSTCFNVKTDKTALALELVDDFFVDGLSSQVITSYCVDFLHSAACYVGLNEMCAISMKSRHFRQKGYIFKEVCNRISAFLAYYRISISSHNNNTNMLRFHSNTNPQRCQINLLAQVCSVGPYTQNNNTSHNNTQCCNTANNRTHTLGNRDNTNNDLGNCNTHTIGNSIGNRSNTNTDIDSCASIDDRDVSVHHTSLLTSTCCEDVSDVCCGGAMMMPSGVDMINHLYGKVMQLSEGPLLMAMYAVLLPCLELYYSHFLHQWLFYGQFDDPHNEFFISSNQKYVVTKGRTYWTRSYTIQYDLIPSFLAELAEDILHCGKAMSLLAITNHKRSNTLYWSEKIPVMKCCLNFDQLNALKHIVNRYQVDILSETGKFSVTNILRKTLDEDLVFLNLVAQKRAITLKRIQCQKIIDLEKKAAEKAKKMKILKENYELVKQHKAAHEAEELQREIALNEENFKIQQLRDNIIKTEAIEMVEHYDKLFEISDKRKRIVEKNVKHLREVVLKLDTKSAENSEKDDFEILDADSLKDESETVALDPIENNKDPKQINNATEAQEFILTESLEMKNDPNTLESENVVLASKSLDYINANASETPEINANFSESTHAKDFSQARKNRFRIMSSEYNILAHTEFVKSEPDQIFTNIATTDLQKNRLRVLSSDINKELTPIKSKSTTELSALQRNRLKVLSVEYGILKDGSKEDFLNQNLRIKNDNEASKKSSEDLYYECSSNTTMNSMKPPVENIDNKVVDVIFDNKKLALDFTKFDSCKYGPSLFAKFLQSPNFEFSKPIPMSVDTTPMSDISVFKSSEFLNTLPSTAATNFTEEEFEFPAKNKHSYLSCQRIQSEVSQTSVNQSNSTIQNSRSSQSCPYQKARADLNLSTINDLQKVSSNFLKIFLRDSVAIPLRAQVSLTNNALLKYFFLDLKYFRHAQSLRNYFFLLDGEFGRNITDILFEALYKSNSTLDVINSRFLNGLITDALEFSSKDQTMASGLSFKINYVPKIFNLQQVDVLSCISMVYKVPWPLNIAFPSEIISKYDEIFKFLVKLKRVSWVLQKIFMEFKILSKRVGKRFEFLTLSPQYQRLHQFRHVMMHFIQTYENYIVGEVLQSSWFEFQENLEKITNLDDLFKAHFNYIKNIEFMCLLNQKALKIRDAIYGIYTVILKFYEYLRSRQWEFDDSFFTHPNFEKLEQIYNNFENFVKFVFRASRKVANQGCQPQLLQFVDMLNFNDYYSKKIVDNISIDTSTSTS